MSISYDDMNKIMSEIRGEANCAQRRIMRAINGIFDDIMSKTLMDLEFDGKFSDVYLGRLYINALDFFERKLMIGADMSGDDWMEVHINVGNLINRLGWNDEQFKKSWPYIWAEITKYMGDTNTVENKPDDADTSTDMVDIVSTMNAYQEMIDSGHQLSERQVIRLCSMINSLKDIYGWEHEDISRCWDMVEDEDED